MIIITCYLAYQNTSLAITFVHIHSTLVCRYLHVDTHYASTEFTLAVSLVYSLPHLVTTSTVALATDPWHYTTPTVVMTMVGVEW